MSQGQPNNALEVLPNPLIYVAGFYSSYPPYGMRNCIVLGTLLLQRGYLPYLPHLTGIWDMVTPMPYPAWLEIDKGWLRVCQGLIRFPGKSSGADGEEALARELGIPCCKTIAELMQRVPATGSPLITPEQIAEHLEKSQIIVTEEDLRRYWSVFEEGEQG